LGRRSQKREKRVEINHNKKENRITRKLKESILSATTKEVISKSNLHEHNTVLFTAQLISILSNQTYNVMKIKATTCEPLQWSSG